MNSIAFIGFLFVFAFVLYWYAANFEQGSDGSIGLLAIKDEDETGEETMLQDFSRKAEWRPARRLARSIKDRASDEPKDLSFTDKISKRKFEDKHGDVMERAEFAQAARDTRRAAERDAIYGSNATKAVRERINSVKLGKGPAPVVVYTPKIRKEVETSTPNPDKLDIAEEEKSYKSREAKPYKVASAGPAQKSKAYKLTDDGK